jgi:hypothetical protein
MTFSPRSLASPRAFAFVLALAVLFAANGPAHARQQSSLDVSPPRFEAEIVVDGVLDEPEWQQAVVLDGFSQYQPVDGRPASDPTEVRVWYSPQAIHFGIHARELHGDVVRATQANRDNINSEDQIQILLDTNNDNRIAFVFAVNPFGVQADGTRSDNFGGGAGGRSATGGGSRNINPMDGNLDLNPDFRFESAGRLVDDGYVVEVRIPFRSLRFQDAEVQDWGLHILRRVQHSGFQDSWAPAVRANASFLGQSGKLKGLTGFQRGRILEIAPSVTGRLDGAEDSGGDWAYSEEAEIGADIKWGIRQNLTLNGTINPDFSQVEADVGQVVLNERFALFFPEKRPFFLDGLELFDTPSQLIYTRRIVAPVVGTKLAGKVGSTNVATILAVDDQAYSASGDDYPVFAVARVRRDLPGNGVAGAVLTAREVGSDWSRLAGGDIRLYHSQKYFVELEGVGSWTSEGGSTSSGSLLKGTWDRTGRNWGFNYSLNAISPDFRAAAGFVNRTGFISASSFNRLTGYGEEGALFETFGAFGGVNRLWDYENTGDGPLEGGEQLFPSATLRGGWRLSGSVARNFFTYDPAVYTGYEVISSAGAVTPFTVPGQEDNLFSGSFGVTTPTFRSFTASVTYSRGETALFAEAAPGSSRRVDVVLDVRPTAALRTSLQITDLVLERDVDGSQFSSELIPRLKVEYQLTPSVFFRVIGQYAARERSALRDREGRPVLSDGELTTASEQNTLNLDVLFSYRPSPGTLMYLGYGSAMEDVGQKRFEQFDRTADGFFTKISYTFRADR